MTNYKLLKFNGNVYPYVSMTVYNYKLNKDEDVKVSTDKLSDAITKALLSKDENIRDKAKTFDLTVKYFVPHTLVIMGDENKIKKYIDSHNI